MLKLDELAEELRLHTWSVDCPNMRLRRIAASGPPEYVGPGYFRQEADGVIAYKLYPPEQIRSTPQSSFPRRSVPGRILPPDAFHELEAMDMGGTTWRATRTLPEPDTSFLHGGRVLTTVKGVAHELVTRCDRPSNGSHLRMIFFTEEKVPGNASTETTTVTPDGNSRKSSRLDTARFETAFGDFNIYNHPGMLVVETSSPTPFPSRFDIRIVEALGFVLAKPLSWDVLELVENNVECVRIRGKRTAIDARLRPPIVKGTIDMSGGDIWRLFDKYLGMVCLHTEPDFHPASRHVFSVLEASAGAISARGLALGVAIEGVVKDLFPQSGALPATLRPLTSQLREYFRAWPQFEDRETREALYNRVDAMLGRILDVSAKSRLTALATTKAIYSEHIKAWSALRHASAHGVTPGSDDIQRLIDLCDSVTVLMYHLVFLAVGYEGRYCDYSVHGWPRKYYRGRPPTESEIAIAAYYKWKSTGEIHGNDVEHWFAAKDELEKGTY